MANCKLVPKEGAYRLTQNVVLELSPVEAHAVMLVLGAIAGDVHDTVRQYTDGVYDVIHSTTKLHYQPFHPFVKMPGAKVLTQEELSLLGTITPSII